MSDLDKNEISHLKKLKQQYKEAKQSFDSGAFIDELPINSEDKARIKIKYQILLDSFSRLEDEVHSLDEKVKTKIKTFAKNNFIGQKKVDLEGFLVKFRYTYDYDLEKVKEIVSSRTDIVLEDLIESKVKIPAKLKKVFEDAKRLKSTSASVTESEDETDKT